jgi:hypothetical protein
VTEKVVGDALCVFRAPLALSNNRPRLVDMIQLRVVTLSAAPRRNKRILKPNVLHL